jgi:outer membrane lipoprotein-sorting protein
MGKIRPSSMAGLALLAVLTAGAGPLWPAAPPAARKTAAPGHPNPNPGARVAEVLRRWADAQQAVRSAHYRYTRTDHDLVFEQTTVSKGEVWLRKPDLLCIDYRERGEKTFILFTAKSIHLFNPVGKTERVFDKPRDGSFLGQKTPPRSGWKDCLNFALLGEALQQGAYWFYAGLPVADLPGLIAIELAREDAARVCLDLRPRLQRDLVDISRIRVVLDARTWRVREIVTTHGNSITSTLELEEPDLKARVTAASIRVGLPSGWRRVSPGDWPKPPQLTGK